MNAQPKISVIIAAFNREHLIGETIDNLLRQSLPPYELIVIDDGSTDGTADVVRSFGESVRLKIQHNTGPGKARNLGLSLASGDYIQFFDSDDLCTLDKLEKQALALEDSGADLSYCGWIPARLERGEMRSDGIVRQQRRLRNSPIEAILADWFVFFQSILIRRNVINRVGGYPTHSRTGEDVELFFRLALAGVTMHHVSDPLVLLRQHPNGQISAAPQYALERARDQVTLCYRIRHLMEQIQFRPSVFGKLLWRARTWEAEQELTSLDANFTLSSGVSIYPAIRRCRKIIGGARKRIRGWRLGPEFGPGRMTEHQRSSIRALGYELR